MPARGSASASPLIALGASLRLTAKRLGKAETSLRWHCVVCITYHHKYGRADYLDAGVSYYLVFDPLKYLSETVLQIYQRRGNSYHLQENFWLEEINLGLTLWSGEFENKFYEQWLRWCDQSGQILLTGDEKVVTEKQRADAEQQRAEQEQQRAEQERQRADAEQQRAERLAQILREQGIDPNNI